VSGYSPVFGSLFRGSLCGQWPALPVFCTLLPLADKDGILDYSFGYLAGVTGWPEALLREGIAQLEAPDPASRNPMEDGRRIVRLRGNTEWGWRIVNHSDYREKARLMAKSAREVAEGKNAGRMQDRRRPPETAADPLSNSNTNSDSGRLRSDSGSTLSASYSERAPPTLLKSAPNENKRRLSAATAGLLKPVSQMKDAHAVAYPVGVPRGPGSVSD